MYNWLVAEIKQHLQIVKFLISGAIAAVVNLTLLYVCTDMFHFWYLASSWIAFVFTFFVSFTLQRFWTFRGGAGHLMKKQVVMYFITATVNIGINTLLMLCFVEYVHLHYLFAQFITIGIISFWSFFVYQRLIFVSPR